MRSEFVEHFTHSLSLSRPVSPSPVPTIQTQSISSRKPALHALLVSLSQPRPSSAHIASCTLSLRDLTQHERDELKSTEADLDLDEEVLTDAIMAKLAVAVYAEALDAYLGQAIEVDGEAEWWGEVERSGPTGVAWFLLQTLPLRLVDLCKTILRTLHIHQLPLTLAELSPASLSSLFSPRSFSLRPGLLTTALFPHLAVQPSQSLAVLLPFSISSTSASRTSTQPVLARVSFYLSFAKRVVRLPLDLTRAECRYKRKALEQMRDERACVLGRLALLRGQLGSVVGSAAGMGVGAGGIERYGSFLASLVHILDPTHGHISETGDIFGPLTVLSTRLLPSLPKSHAAALRPSPSSPTLLRPASLTLLWPRLLLIPPIALYLYRNTTTTLIPALRALVADARDTALGFWEGWVMGPLGEVVRTMRGGTGVGEGMVSLEGIRSDLESLERMTQSLASDLLHYTPEQLASLGESVRSGDLTAPIMEVYEADVRRPVGALIGGRLVRHVLVQVQKAKVDTAHALLGIDRLLASQRLTFAFVGVAPALGILYLFGVGRIEAILLQTPPNPFPSIFTTPPPLPALPTGLLLLSLARLRTYAHAHLPPHIRGPFLEDLEMLEDPGMGVEGKIGVVARVWRCWGGVLEG
ncbi:ATP synthase regulation protein NCA2-domain-containing protein [Crassisporium funariophilum]|nr:ATP synthase regulation protein NCA2-domain-containing protein [Crassisporium funariophilum]